MKLSLGELIDKLTIVNIKCFLEIDKSSDMSLPDSERLKHHDNVRALNSDRNKLIKAINELSSGSELSNLKIYRNGQQG